jgi:hypothetical protein
LSIDEKKIKTAKRAEIGKHEMVKRQGREKENCCKSLQQKREGNSRAARNAAEQIHK